MLMNGLQGLATKEPATIRLLAALQPLMDRTEEAFEGFDDFYQLSGAISGLCRFSGRDEAAGPFVDSFARMVGKGCKQSKSGGSASSVSRIGMALFGLQSLPHRRKSVETILSSIGPFIDSAPSLDGKAVGMGLQGFKKCVGRPTQAQEAILASMCSKMSGWSLRGKNKPRLVSPTPAGAASSKAANAFLTESQVTQLNPKITPKLSEFNPKFIPDNIQKCLNGHPEV